MVHKSAPLALFALAIALLVAPLARADFAAFESGQARPLALSDDGTRLYAVNTPDNRLEIFEVGDGGLVHLAGVSVGLEPVAVAARSASEVWVVNHLSDSVSIVDVASSPPRVVRTLLVGDEPSDIVFAGTSGNRAFITTARRGQNDLSDPMLTTEGEGRARVWVFDANDLGSAAGGTPLTVLTLFGDKPRALARNASGTRVFAAVFHSGNQTTSLTGPLVHSPALPPGLGPLDPNRNAANVVAPFTGLIVKNTGPNQWVDHEGQNWDFFVPFDLPDLDVFEIDADAAAPVEVDSYAHVGTVLFNMAVNPANGRLYVTNGEADNTVRFEGPGTFASTPAFGLTPPFTVRGNLHRYRVTVIDPTTDTVTPRHLNKHIDYSLAPAAQEATGAKNHSLATPLGLAVKSDGSKMYLTAFGSSKVGVLVPSELESDAFDPNDADHIDITGGGPTGVVLDEARDRLYVLARFDNSISIVDTTTHPGVETDVVPLPNDPEPASIRDGRKFLYDARLTSANGEASCSSCHVFGNLDSLAWDLGNPDGSVLQNNNTQALIVSGIPLSIDFLQTLISLNLIVPPPGFFLEHHPMKGPMLTQSLRGMANHGPMHWRGDRSGGTFRTQGGGDPESLNEEKAFKAFNVAFEGLLGRTGPLTTPEMQAYTDFILQVRYPPNPIRALDNSLTASQANGRDIYMNVQTDGQVGGGNSFTCNTCHTLNEAEANGGFFGTDGDSSFDGETQIIKIPHLRNVYDRIGMFGTAGADADPNAPGFQPENTGDQVRGYGFLHDGIVDTLFRFVGPPAFTFPGNAAQQLQGRRDMESFMLAFDSDMAPVVGQQVSLDDDDSDPNLPLLAGDPNTATGERVDLLVARGLVSTPRAECDLIVKGIAGGEPRGWFMTGPDTFVSDREGELPISESALRAIADAPGNDLVWTCSPPNTGWRAGVDRDDDGIVDGSECGDINGDGVAAESEPVLMRRAFAGTLTPGLFVGAKCNVVGPIDTADTNGDGLPDDCTIQDWAVQVRRVAGLAPGLSQVCSAAL